MNEVEMNIIELNEKKYFLVDSISENNKIYHYFSNLKDSDDIKIFEEKNTDKENLTSLEDPKEIGHALSLFNEKYKDSDSIQ